MSLDKFMTDYLKVADSGVAYIFKIFSKIFLYILAIVGVIIYSPFFVLGLWVKGRDKEAKKK